MAISFSRSFIESNSEFQKKFNEAFIASIPNAEIRNDVVARQKNPQHKGRGWSCTDVLNIIDKVVGDHLGMFPLFMIKSTIQEQLTEYSVIPENANSKPAVNSALAILNRINTDDANSIKVEEPRFAIPRYIQREVDCDNMTEAEQGEYKKLELEARVDHYKLYLSNCPDRSYVLHRTVGVGTIIYKENDVYRELVYNLDYSNSEQAEAEYQRIKNNFTPIELYFLPKP